MTTTRDSFNKECYRFVDRCQRLSDDWRLSKVKPNGIEQLEISAIKLDDTAGLELMLTKTEIKNSQDKSNVWTYEYTVLYSDSYEVPVMYFTASNQDGLPVGLDDTIPRESSLMGRNYDLHCIVNQVEHPILFRPFYWIHPCRTRDLMDLHKDHLEGNYLITWLSTVATLLDLKLPLEFGVKVDKLIGLE